MYEKTSVGKIDKNQYITVLEKELQENGRQKNLSVDQKHGHQSISFIAYTSWITINFLFRKFESKFSNRTMLFDETIIELSDTDIGLERIICLTV